MPSEYKSGFCIMKKFIGEGVGIGIAPIHFAAVAVASMSETVEAKVKSWSHDQDKSVTVARRRELTASAIAKCDSKISAAQERADRLRARLPKVTVTMPKKAAPATEVVVAEVVEVAAEPQMIYLGYQKA